MIKEGEDFLIIDDDEDARDTALSSLQQHNIHNVKAPTSVEECERLLAEKRYHTAFIDLRLVNWVGKEKTIPIMLGDKGRFDGLDIASYLSRKFPDMLIGMYSTNEPDLRDGFKKSMPTSRVYMASAKGIAWERQNDFIPDLAAKFLDFDIEVSSLDVMPGTYPGVAEIFLANRLVNIPGPGNFLWRNGPFSWRVYSNKHFKEIFKESPTLETGQQTHAFKLKTDRVRQGLDEFESEKAQIKMDESSIDRFLQKNRVDERSFDKTIGEIVAGQFTADLYLIGAINAKSANYFFKQLSSYAQLLSQKYLFKRLKKKAEVQDEGNAAIDRQLAYFHQQGLPQVIDIYKGVIEKVEGNKAYVNLESIGTEGLRRMEAFQHKLLQEKGLEEYARFEYTMFKLEGGTAAYNIEPI